MDASSRDIPRVGGTPIPEGLPQGPEKAPLVGSQKAADDLAKRHLGSPESPSLAGSLPSLEGRGAVIRPGSAVSDSEVSDSAVSDSAPSTTAAHSPISPAVSDVGTVAADVGTVAAIVLEGSLSSPDKSEAAEARLAAEAKAATKIQAFARERVLPGHRARNRIVLPKRIHGFLHKSFVTGSIALQAGAEEEAFLSKAAVLACREINDKLNQPASRGQSFKITSLEGSVRQEYSEEPQEYPRLSDPIFAGLDEAAAKAKLAEMKKKEKTVKTEVPVDLWMTISADGKTVSLQFKPKDALLLGKGTYKMVYPAQDIKVDMARTKKVGEESYSRKTESAASVRVSETGVELGKVDSERTERGAEVYNACFLELQEAQKRGEAKGVYISTPHVQLAAGEMKQVLVPQMRLVGGVMKQVLVPHEQLAGVEMKQVRYATDLEKMLIEGTVRRDLDVETQGVQPHNVTPAEKLECVKDVAISLKWLNEQGITHRDGKTANVNILYGKDDNGVERPIASIADFDYANEEFGYDPKAGSNNYAVWDPCCAYGNIATPYVDRYGVAQMLCQTVIPGISYDNFKHARLAIMTAVYRNGPVELNPKKYLTGLNPNQEKAFAAFLHVCYESALLYKELEAELQDDFPEDVTDAHVQAAMTKLQDAGELTHDMDHLIQVIDQIIIAG